MIYIRPADTELITLYADLRSIRKVAKIFRTDSKYVSARLHANGVQLYQPKKPQDNVMRKPRCITCAKGYVGGCKFIAADAAGEEAALRGIGAEFSVTQTGISDANGNIRMIAMCRITECHDYVPGELPQIGNA